MDKYGKHSNMAESTYDVQETLNEILEGGVVKKTQKMRKKIDKLIKDEKAINYIATKLEFADELRIEEFRKMLSESKGISKPIFETFLSDSFVFHDKKLNTIDIVINELGKDILEDKYDEKFLPVLEELYELKSDQFFIRYYTFEEYMYKLERGI
jgi:hypothetical protein